MDCLPRCQTITGRYFKAPSRSFAGCSYLFLSFLMTMHPSAHHTSSRKLFGNVGLLSLPIIPCSSDLAPSDLSSFWSWMLSCRATVSVATMRSRRLLATFFFLMTRMLGSFKMAWECWKTGTESVLDAMPTILTCRALLYQRSAPNWVGLKTYWVLLLCSSAYGAIVHGKTRKCWYNWT